MKKLLFLFLIVTACHKEKIVTRQMQVNTDAITHVITVNGTDIGYNWTIEPNVTVKTGDIIHFTGSTTNATLSAVMYIDGAIVLNQQGSAQTVNFSYTCK